MFKQGCRLTEGTLITVRNISSGSSSALHQLAARADFVRIVLDARHASLVTTNHYAEITTKTKEKALRVCELPWVSSEELHQRAIWKDDQSLLDWLNSL
jgi:hypothetical protein